MIFTRPSILTETRMLPRSWCVRLLGGFCLLVAGAPSAWGQEFFPPGLERQPPVPFPLAPGVTDPLGAIPLETPRPMPRWYADAELAVLFTGAVHFNDRFATVERDRPVFISPRLYLGYRMENGGSVRVTYRNLTQVGFGDSGSPPPGWSLDQWFSTNWFDLDYVSREFAPRDWWRLQLEAGGRFVYRNQGWRSESPYSREDGSDNFFAGGPHLGLTSQALLGDSGWVVYGRADTAVTFGGGYSAYNYQPQGLVYWRSNMSRSDRASFSACQFDLGLQLGLVKRWQWRRYDLGLGAGVQGDLLTLANLQGDVNAFGLVNVGPFVRLELRF